MPATLPCGVPPWSPRSASPKPRWIWFKSTEWSAWWPWPGASSTRATPCSSLVAQRSGLPQQEDSCRGASYLLDQGNPSLTATGIPAEPLDLTSRRRHRRDVAWAAHQLVVTVVSDHAAGGAILSAAHCTAHSPAHRRASNCQVRPACHRFSSSATSTRDSAGLSDVGMVEAAPGRVGDG
jgi:hypothetical protein